MADVPLVLNDALCFIACKYGKIAVKLLKTSLADFYAVDDLATVKQLLIRDIDDMKLSMIMSRPRAPPRHDGEGRLAREINDIIALFTFVDEHRAMDSLPKYVSGSPHNMPSLRLYQGDLNAMLTMLRTLEHKMSGFESALVAMSREVQELQVSRSRDPPPSHAASSGAYVPEPSSCQQQHQQQRQPTVSRPVTKPLGNSTTVDQQQSADDHSGDERVADSTAGALQMQERQSMESHQKKYSKSPDEIWLSWLSCVVLAKRNSQASRPVNVATNHQQCVRCQQSYRRSGHQTRQEKR